MKNFLRRLVRFVNDPRYGFFYSRWPVSPKEFWKAIEARTLAYQLSVGADPKPGVTQYCTRAYLEFCRELRPKLEWPDFLGNALFVFFSIWVVWRAFVVASPFVDRLAGFRSCYRDADAAIDSTLPDGLAHLVFAPQSVLIGFAGGSALRAGWRGDTSLPAGCCLVSVRYQLVVIVSVGVVTATVPNDISRNWFAWARSGGERLGFNHRR